MSVLEIKDLHTSVAGKNILKGLNLSLPKGEVHIIMGPNGVGKSTLCHVLMGNKNYDVASGSIWVDGQNVDSFDTAERARAGLFLGFQYPVAIPGLKVSEYLRNLYTLHHGQSVGISEFRKILREKLDLLSIDKSAMNRYLNDGFSGGEMKRLELLQLALIEPKIAILDEIDSGVDLDAQKIIAEAITKIATNIGTSFLIITHYQRLLSFLKSSRIHVLMDGAIIRSGDISLVEALEKEGYEWVRKQKGDLL